MVKNIIAIHTAPRTLTIQSCLLPPPAEEYVCVRFEYCAICGGDYSVYLGRRNVYPISLGHEFVACVIEVGKGVESVHPGDLVTSDFNYRCGSCEQCVKGASHLCVENDVGLFSNRGFAQFANIHESYLVVIPPFPYLPRACLIEPLSCVLHACQQMGLKEGSSVLLCGGGGIGSLFCFYLKRILHVQTVVVNETNQYRLRHLEKCFQITSYQKQNRPRKFNYIIDSSNSVEGMKFCLETAQPGAHLCIMSHLYGLSTSFVYETICRKELVCIFPLRNGEKQNLYMASDYLLRYWNEQDDETLHVYDNIRKAFIEKATDGSCKQIIKTSALTADLQ